MCMHVMLPHHCGCSLSRRLPPGPTSCFSQYMLQATLWLQIDCGLREEGKNKERDEEDVLKMNSNRGEKWSFANQRRR